jgi:N-terminal domain of toast_rack, DUF2154
MSVEEYAMSDRKDQLRGTSVVFPLLLIGFGALMLLWRWMPNFHPWGVLLKYWPLLFICIGAGMIWDRTRWQSTSPDGRRFPIGSALGTLVFLLVITILIHRDQSYFPRYSGKASAASTHETRTVDRGAATSLRMNVAMPAGELIFQGGGEHLLSADFFQDGSWQVPQVDYSVADTVGNLKISQSGNDQFITKSDNTWNLKVDNSMPLELKVDVGAGRGEFHLADVDITLLELNIGAGQAQVDLTGERAKDLLVKIEGGVGEAVVRLPKNVGVIATLHGGLGSIDVHGMKEEDGHYVNDAYGKSSKTIHLTVEGGIGQIKLEQE